MGPATRKLVEAVREGDRAALARGITLVENADPRGEALLAALGPGAGRALRLGLTGPPGAGKSTLARSLARLWADDGSTVGVLAVDPSSPFSGGALLGDRVRMTSLALHPRVFIRSMASRGALGGLAAQAQAVADLLDAFGCDVILFETVGVGQSEVDVAGAADTAVLVLSPESGDGIQAMKAGLMEIADVVAVNKADRPGADRTVVEIEQMLALRPPPEDGWAVPVLRTVAERDEGAEPLRQAVLDHGSHLRRLGLWEDRRRAKARRRIALSAEAEARAALRRALDEEAWNRSVEEVMAGRATVRAAARRLFAAALDRLGPGGAKENQP